MHLSMTHNMLAITLQEDAKTFYFLQNLADKHFSKKIGRKNKVIIFKENSEEVQRRYFLKLLSKLYTRYHGSSDEAGVIEKALDKTIKLTLLRSNQLLQRMNIAVRIEDNYAIIFQFETHHPLLSSYLKNYFKEHLIRIRPKHATLTLYPNGAITATLLHNLLSQRELLGVYTHFSYDEKVIHHFTHALLHKKHKRSHQHALFSLLEEYFYTLGCRAEDTFETIRYSYLNLVKRYHPDACGLYDGDLHVKYVAKFQEIQRAYEMLKIHFKEKEACSA